jgi:hypothetical protein
MPVFQAWPALSSRRAASGHWLAAAEGRPGTAPDWNSGNDGLVFVEADIGRPGRRCQNARRVEPARLLNGRNHRGAGRFRLVLVACDCHVIQATPKAIDPDRALRFMALIGKPVGTCSGSNSRQVDREFAGSLGRAGRGSPEQQEEQCSHQHLTRIDRLFGSLQQFASISANADTFNEAAGPDRLRDRAINRKSHEATWELSPGPIVARQ